MTIAIFDTFMDVYISQFFENKFRSNLKKHILIPRQQNSIL